MAPTWVWWVAETGSTHQPRRAVYYFPQQQGVSSGGYYQERGLGDEALQDINFREQANDARLDGREKLMNIRHIRITSDEQRLLTTPVIGNNSELMALRAKVQALTTYPASAPSNPARYGRPARQPATLPESANAASTSQHAPRPVSVTESANRQAIPPP
jgi:hypothetical protein